MIITGMKSLRQVRLVALFFLFLLPCFCSLFSEEEVSRRKPEIFVGLRGLVISEDNVPLDNVAVIGEKGLLAVSDADGFFYIERVGLEEVLTLYRYGYETVFESISAKEDKIQPGETYKTTIVMSREAVFIEGLTVLQPHQTISAAEGMRIFIPVTSEMRGESLVSILSDYPEIGLSSPLLSGERQTVSLMNHPVRHTLILIDGIPMNSQGQPYDISTIPTETIESIEIIRGGASAFSGPGSIGGLISINTRQPLQRYDLSLQQSIASYNSHKTAFSFYHRHHFLGFGFYADMSRAENDFVYYDSNGLKKRREYNNKAFHNLHFRISGQFDSILSLAPELSYKAEISGFDNKLPGPTNYEIFYRDARLEGESIKHRLTASFRTKQLLPRITFYHHQSRTEYDNTRAAIPLFPIVSEHQNDKSGIILNVQTLSGYSFVPRNEFNLEYEREGFHYREKTNPDNSIPAKKQESFAIAARSHFLTSVPGNSPFSRILGRGTDWDNSLSLRYDLLFRDYQKAEKESADNEGKSEQDFFSWRFDSAMHFYYPFDWSIGGGINRSYSLPSFYDLYWKGDSQTMGNPYLKTEKSLGINAFGELNIFNFIPRLEFYQSRIDDLIYWYQSGAGWKPGNIARAEITNLKVSAEYNYTNFLNLSASWLKTEALNKSRNSDGSASDLYGKKIIYTPEQNLQMTITFRHSYLFGEERKVPLYWRISHSYTGKQWSTPDQLIHPVSSYELTDTEFGVELTGMDLKWLITLRLNNVFNNRYEIYAYMPQPGFNWLLSLKINYAK